MQADVNRLNAELERGAAALMPAVKAMPQVPCLFDQDLSARNGQDHQNQWGLLRGDRVLAGLERVASSFWCFRWSFAEGEFGREVQIPFGGIEGARSKAAGPPLPFASAYPANIFQLLVHVPRL